MPSKATISRAIVIGMLIVALFAQIGFAQKDGNKKPDITVDENARQMLLKYYPDMALVNVFASSFNKPGKKDGRFAATLTSGDDGWLKVVDIKNRDIVEVFESRYAPNRPPRLNPPFTHNNEHIIAIWPEI